MRKLLILFILSIHFTAFTQQETKSLSVEDKKLTDFVWQDNFLYVEISSGTKTYGNKNNLEHKMVALDESYTVNNLLSSDDLSYKEFFGPEGNIAIRASVSYFAGRVLLKSDKKEPLAFVDSSGKEYGVIEELENTKLYYDGENEHTFLTKDYLIGVAPPKKKFAKSKKERLGQKVAWLLYKLELPTRQHQTTPLLLNEIEGKEEGANFLLKVGKEHFYVLNKKYTVEGRKDVIKSQSITIYKYDFDGNLVDEVRFTENLFNAETHNYAYAGLENAFIYKEVGGVTKRSLNELATGTVIVDEENEWYYFVSFLKGLKSKIEMRVNLTKYDFNGNKIWSINEPYEERTERDLDLKYRSLDYMMTKDQFIFPNRLGEVTFINNDGTMSKSTLPETKWKRVNDKLGVSVLWKNGEILKDFSKKVLLDEKVVIFSLMNTKIYQYFKSLDPKSYLFVNGHIDNDGVIHILTIGNKERDINLLRFDSNE